MKKTKYYAVKHGRKKGVFKTWEECKAQVIGFPNAKYKSFESLKEAKDFIKNTNENKTKLKDVEVIAYVDGSFDRRINEGSFGMVILHGGQFKKMSGLVTDKDMLKMNNVAGEIMGAEQAIRYAINNGYKSLAIYHDYAGISEWANGDWNANTIGTKKYQDFCKEAKKKIDIHFVKVKGHSGDFYNDIADELAKKVLKNRWLEVY